MGAPLPAPSGTEAFVGAFFSYKLEQVLNLPPADSVHEQFVTASPYPHLVLPNFFTSEIVDLIRTETVDAEQFSQTFTDEFQLRKSISTGDRLPPFIQALAAKFASPEMLNYLERVTGLRKLIPDPYFNTDYGYYHVTRPGGVLGSHVDHSHHDRLGTPHVLNLVVYLSPDWKHDDGGALCLFDDSGKRVVKRVPCDFNTGILFSSSPIAFHGVDPIREGCGRQRHSLYFAYYCIAEGEKATLQANFPSVYAKGRHDPTEVFHSTYFVVPFHKLFLPRNWRHLRTRIRYLAKLFIPPIVTVLFSRISRRS
jgi:Rps23 Pro-64 3,4-dihydroxylase Tpa1-like proline 4-hydroxylase